MRKDRAKGDGALPWRIPSAWASLHQKPPSYLFIHIFISYSFSTELGAALQPVGMCKRQEVEGLERHMCPSPPEDATQSIICTPLSIKSCVAGVLTMYLLCVHILATTLGLCATSVKMAKVNTQCSLPSPTRCSVKTTDRDLESQNSLSR